MITLTYIREVDNNELHYGPIIACIEKNRSQDIRIRLWERHGDMYVDVRVFAEGKGDDGRHPIKRGVTLKVERLPELVDGLLSAERDRATGLIQSTVWVGRNVGYAPDFVRFTSRSRHSGQGWECLKLTPSRPSGDEIDGPQACRNSAFGVPRFDGGRLFFNFTMLTININ